MIKIKQEINETLPVFIKDNLLNYNFKDNINCCPSAEFYVEDKVYCSNYKVDFNLSTNEKKEIVMKENDFIKIENSIFDSICLSISIKNTNTFKFNINDIELKYEDSNLYINNIFFVKNETLNYVNINLINTYGSLIIKCENKIHFTKDCRFYYMFSDNLNINTFLCLKNKNIDNMLQVDHLDVKTFCIPIKKGTNVILGNPDIKSHILKASFYLKNSKSKKCGQNLSKIYTSLLYSVEINVDSKIKIKFCIGSEIIEKEYEFKYDNVFISLEPESFSIYLTKGTEALEDIINVSCDATDISQLYKHSNVDCFTAYKKFFTKKDAIGYATALVSINQFFAISKNVVEENEKTSILINSTKLNFNSIS